ncbi:MAG: SH3 domain-containing protein [Chloroflexota bacterium]|nr:SH3 domain-containing protein [Chloroflexota bacterium]
MRKPTINALRALAVLVFALGFIGLSASPAGTQTRTGCAYGDDAFILGLVDPTKDGTMTLADLQVIADDLSETSPFKAELEQIIVNARADGLTQIRYDGTGVCAVTPTPITPTATPITPTATPVTPTATPVTPTATPITPTATPVTPTATPVTPTATPVPPTPTLAPVVANGTVTTVGTTLACRTQPNTDATVIMRFQPGARVEITGPVSSGWYPVRCGGQNGWAFAEFIALDATSTATPITPTATPVTPTATPVTPTATPITPTATPVTPTPTQQPVTFGTVTTVGLNLRCRTAPVTGDVITSFAPGARVEVTGPVSNGWYPVRCASQDGWASAEFIALDGTPTPTSAPVTPTATSTPVTPTATATPGTTTGTVTNTGGDNLRCRTAPVSGTIITSLGPGTQVQVRGPLSNGWYPVRCAGQDGWVSAQYLTVGGTSTPTPTPTPGTTFGTVTNTGGDNLRCRVSPINGSVITSLAPGARVEVRGPVASGWYPVRCANQNGWVSAQYLTVGGGNPGPGPGPGPTVGYIDTAGAANANCRSQPSLSGGIITTVAYGSQVTIRGTASNDWTPVRCGNQDGWIFSQLISTQPPAGLGPVDRVVRAADVTRTRRRSRMTPSRIRGHSMGLPILANRNRSHLHKRLTRRCGMASS